ncbi:MAG: hypothetical protein ACRDXX_03040 [Stackebrandtia sp.]
MAISDTPDICSEDAASTENGSGQRELGGKKFCLESSKPKDSDSPSKYLLYRSWYETDDVGVEVVVTAGTTWAWDKANADDIYEADPEIDQLLTEINDAILLTAMEGLDELPRD